MSSVLDSLVCIVGCLKLRLNNDIAGRVIKIGQINLPTNPFHFVIVSTS